ncbi:MAG TPA: hypothetical protein VHX44_14940 [Planctomycetota bacterium]|nr:hypothetical protein [Planctomycetota bacterium]
MRSLITGAIGLALAIGCTSTLSAADPAKPVNTICPHEGDKIDPTVKPVTVTTKDGKTVTIGVCCKDCVDAITKNPEKFAAAALANKKAAE